MTTAETTIPEGLHESVPANNQKIIEIYNKLRSGTIAVNKSYQRKLVWKNAHKFNFIDTILRNFPFPEIYLAAGSLDQIKLVLIDEIVDGQQRLTTIRDYIEGTDVFALPKIPVARFAELTPTQRASFLNYEVSVRYLKNVSKEQVVEIFQRINKTDYALNAAERSHAQWGESEFVCFAKQIIDPSFELEGTLFIVDQDARALLSTFFNGKDEEDESVFSDNDKARMLAYQYIMTLVATLDEGEYFHRNEKLSYYIKAYNDEFPHAADLLERLKRAVNFINNLGIPRFSRWYKKANLFTLIVETDKAKVEEINPAIFASHLQLLDHKASMVELGFEAADGEKLTPEEERYIGFAREAVNQKNAREYRGAFINSMIMTSLKNTV